MDKVYVGYISSFFGLKGEIKVLSDLNHLDKIFKVGNTLIVDDKEYKIKKSRLQKNHYIIQFEEINSIEEANLVLKKNIYINRDNIYLDTDEYLISDFVDCKIIDNEKIIGNVENILYNKNNFFIQCDKLIIPINEKYFEKIDINKKEIYVKNTKELKL